MIGLFLKKIIIQHKYKQPRKTTVAVYVTSCESDTQGEGNGND